MKPAASTPQVSAFMSRLKTAGTDPELAIRRELHKRGLRFRVNVRGLAGTPDIVFTRARLVIQIDGCFWHGCPEHSTTPKSNAVFWAEKILANQRRDDRDDRALEQEGWVVLRVWEHEDPSPVADRIEQLWRSRTGR